MIVRNAVPSDAAGIAKVAVNTWRTAYRGIVPDEVLDGLSYERKEQKWRNQLTAESAIVFVAENGTGEVVGYANGGKERSGHPMFQGELYALYVLNAYQQSGIGKRLLASVAHALAELQIGSMRVWVLERNPARYFYEAMGAAQEDTRTITIGGTALQEIGYGWKDTSSILTRSR